MKRTALTALMVVQLVLVLLLAGQPTIADVRLPAVIGSHMVLQQGQEVPIWGWADAGEGVTVTFRGQEASAEAGPEGRWMVRLTALSAGGPDEMVVTGNNTLALTDILVGEVWVCSGQSNMGFAVRSSNNAQEEIAAANYPQLRLFSVAHRPSEQREADTQGSWVACTPETVPGFTAVGYFFGRKLHQDLGVPVGLINSSWGGTMGEAWTSREALASSPTFQPVFDRWQSAEANYPQQKAQFDEKLKAWEQQAQEAKAKGEQPPARPRPPMFEQKQNQPAGLFSGMIAPLLPYAIRGAIWYQGEANAGRAYAYRELLPLMITDWRASWGQGDFPFYIVQLANFMKRVDAPVEAAAWPELREAQSMTLSLPNTGQAVTIDIGEADDIHPRNKQDVGLRLALIALAQIHGRDVEYSGPVYESIAVEDGKIRLTFSHADGMQARGDTLKGFAVAGEDQAWAAAEARIEGDSILVWSDQVTAPVAARYGWANNPDCNLYNAAGLPASPFRTDDWPGVTANAR